MSLQEFMAFMISRETENVKSCEEVLNAFKSLTTGDKPYVMVEELYAVSTVTYVVCLLISSLVVKVGKSWIACHSPDSTVYELYFIHFAEPHTSTSRILCITYETLRR